jgi:lysylphosphatidylglycerol synthetase-like protein (DUF2156 family)
MKNCEKCGSKNESDVRFCVNCGNKLVASTAGAPSNHAVHVGASPRTQQGIVDGYQYHESASLHQTSNPLGQVWNGFLMQERMIVIGAVIGCVAAILEGNSNFLSASVYFIIMLASLYLIYTSINIPVVKKIELVRWQIAIGAFFLMSIDSLYYLIGRSMTSSSSLGAHVFSSWLSLISSILILVGAIMLQGILVRHAFHHKK